MSEILSKFAWAPSRDTLDSIKSGEKDRAAGRITEVAKRPFADRSKDIQPRGRKQKIVYRAGR